MLTIVTASHRNTPGLMALGKVLLPHLGPDLRWVIKDSGSCASTARWASTLTSPWSRLDAAPDSGIYDALNQALQHVTTSHYLVVGSDDTPDPVALRQVVVLLTSIDEAARADIVTFPVGTAAGTRQRRRGWPSAISAIGLVASHSMGTLIRRDLHDRLGPYDTRYRILADSLFLRRAWLTGARFDHHDGPILGRFGLGGISNVEHGRRLAETYSYLASTGSPCWLQAGLLALRLLRYRPATLL